MPHRALLILAVIAWFQTHHAHAEPPSGGTAGPRAVPVALSPTDRDALARVAFAEAGNQGPAGLAAVVYTVLNRVASGKFQDNVQAAIDATNQFEPVARVGGWRRLPPLSRDRQAQFDLLLASIERGGLPDPTGGALYFQNRAIVAARAAAGLVPPDLLDFGGRAIIAEIGDHSFYDDRPGRRSRGAVPRRPAPAGWGLVLGAYPQEFRALRAIELAKSGLALPKDTGRPIAVPLKDGKFFGALLVDLRADQATAACEEMRRSGAFCVALAPDELRDPDIAWRPAGAPGPGSSQARTVPRTSS